jgi:F-type H+-transporting ATPase subunit gamma
MAKPRAILNKANSIRSIAKITGTMEKIATSRFKRAFDRAVAARPYTDRLGRLIAELTAASGGIDHPLLQEREQEKVALLGIASNRGLCGGYNLNVARAVVDERKRLLEEGKQVDMWVSGGRLATMLKFYGIEFAGSFTHIDDRPRFADVDEIAQSVMRQFLAKELDGLTIVYTKFLSAARQQVAVEQVLPLGRPVAEEIQPQSEREWIFSPDPESILADLLPRSVRLQVFQSFLDAGVSEQIARRVAMKNATDNANDLIKSLTLTYNRSRQALITTELSEIIGGAVALE